MTNDILDILSNYGTPSLSNRRVCLTQTINQFGDVCVLTNKSNEPIVFENLRDTNEKSKVDSLPFDISCETFHAYQFNNIEFNCVGNCLLVWNDTIAGIIAIPQSLLLDGMITLPDESSPPASSKCHFQLIAKDFLVANSGAQRHIAKASYHISSPYHILILLEDGLLLLVDTIRDITQTITLSTDKKYTTFTFGPSSSDWMKYTIILATSKNEIMLLCPLIPYGTQVSPETCEQMWSWLDDQCESGVNENYLVEVESYMRAVFPRSSAIEQSLASMTINDRNENASDDNDDYLVSTYLTPRYATPSPPVRGNKLGQKESIELVNALTRPVQVQGPIPIETQQQSNARGKITDICCIRSKQQAAADSPVIVIAYASGIVDICILCCGDETPYSFVNPIWGDMKRSSQLQSLPHLVVTNSVDVTNVSTFQSVKPTGLDTWFIQADPVIPYCFHAFGHKGEFTELIG